MHPIEMLFDAKFDDMVNLHFEEESDMSPAAFSAGIDLVELASRMSQRRKEIVESLIRSSPSRKVLATARHPGADDRGMSVEIPRVDGTYTYCNAAGRPIDATTRNASHPRRRTQRNTMCRKSFHC